MMKTKAIEKFPVNLLFFYAGAEYLLSVFTAEEGLLQACSVGYKTVHLNYGV